MREHLVIRNADLNNLDVIRLKKIDYFVTQTRIGGAPFKCDESGLPVKIKVGDDLWIAESGLGVVGKSAIIEVQPCRTISRLEDIEELRREFSGYLDASYWDSVRDSLATANERNRPLCFIAIKHRVKDVLHGDQVFRIQRPKGAISSWVTFEDDAAREAMFVRRSAPNAFEAMKVKGNYGVISGETKYFVMQIWKDLHVGVKASEEAVHFDHFVPKALGGPGIFYENVVPMPAQTNLAKSKRPPRSVAEVARQWGILSAEEFAAWGALDAEGDSLLRQEDLTRRVTAAIRNQAERVQRRFYYEVLLAGLGESVGKLFEAAGAAPAPLPNHPLRF